MPSWDLSVVFSGLQRAPFEPLESVELKILSLKTLLLYRRMFENIYLIHGDFFYIVTVSALILALCYSIVANTVSSYAL